MNHPPSRQELWDLARQTLTAPREAAAEALRNLPVREALWLVFALVVVVTVLLESLLSAALGAAGTSVFSLIIVYAGALALGVFLTHGVGRGFGGTGEFNGALGLALWLEVVFFALQILLVITTVLFPPLFLLGLVAFIGLRLWVTASFIAELHGFSSPGMVLLVMLAVLVFMGIVLVVVAGALGIELPMADMAAGELE